MDNTYEFPIDVFANTVNPDHRWRSLKDADIFYFPVPRDNNNGEMYVFYNEDEDYFFSYESSRALAKGLEAVDQQFGESGPHYFLRAGDADPVGWVEGLVADCYDREEIMEGAELEGAILALIEHMRNKQGGNSNE